MGRRSRAHVDEYELGEDGSYRYTGSYWRWLEPELRPGTIGFAWGLLGVAGAGVLGAGLVPDPATTGVAYVLVPYVVAVVAWVLSAAALWTLSREGERLRNHVYQRSAAVLSPRLTAACIAALACGVGCLAHGLLSGQCGWTTWLFVTLMLGSGLCQGQLAALMHRVGFVRE